MTEDLGFVFVAAAFVAVILLAVVIVILPMFGRTL